MSTMWNALLRAWGWLGNLFAYPVVWYLRRKGNRVDLDTWYTTGPTATWFYDRYWGGVTLSRDVTLIWLPDTGQLTHDELRVLGELITHESRHRWQAGLLGPLYLPVYGALFLVWSAWYRSWLRGYENHPLERDAESYTARMVGR